MALAPHGRGNGRWALRPHWLRGGSSPSRPRAVARRRNVWPAAFFIGFL